MQLNDFVLISIAAIAKFQLFYNSFEAQLKARAFNLTAASKNCLSFFNCLEANYKELALFKIAACTICLSFFNTSEAILKAQTSF